VVHQLHRPGLRRRALVRRLILEDVPERTTRGEVLEALETAGLAAVYAEGGVPWANHQLLPERRWPDVWDAGPPPAEWTWEALTGPHKGKKLGLRLAPDEWADVTTAARMSGLSVQAWANRVLVGMARGLEWAEVTP